MEEELPIDSDSSDEDYVPRGHENEMSEEESGNESVDDPGSDVEKCKETTKKRKKPTKTKKRKKIKNGKNKEEDKEEEKENSEILTEEEKKKKCDLLWADFMKDCGPPENKIQPAKIEAEPESQPETKPKAQPSGTGPSKVTQILTFAGEEVRVEKPVSVGEPSRRGVRASTGGLSSVLSQIGKKGKLSTLEKSKLDWDGFKSKEGIVEELQRHNKGKNGYLEKQDFLQRADLRQFEIEKNMRSASRRSLNR